MSQTLRLALLALVGTSIGCIAEDSDDTTSQPEKIIETGYLRCGEPAPGCDGIATCTDEHDLSTCVQPAPDQCGDTLDCECAGAWVCGGRRLCRDLPGGFECAAPPLPDASPDMGQRDRGVVRDVSPPDRGVVRDADLRPADAAIPDAAVPDAAVPDAVAPDGLVPDAACIAEPCPDPSGCTSFVWDPDRCACRRIDAPDGDPCDDGDACTGMGECRRQTCEPGPAVVCDAGQLCLEADCEVVALECPQAWAVVDLNAHVVDGGWAYQGDRLAIGAPTEVCDRSDDITAVHVFVAPRAAQYAFETTTSGANDFDTVVEVRWACEHAHPENRLACNDDGGVGVFSRAVVALEAGQTVYPLVGAFIDGQMAGYRLTVTAQ